jgi:hypothetical protein
MDQRLKDQAEQAKLRREQGEKGPTGTKCPLQGGPFLPVMALLYTGGVGSTLCGRLH